MDHPAAQLLSWTPHSDSAKQAPFERRLVSTQYSLLGVWVRGMDHGSWERVEGGMPCFGKHHLLYSSRTQASSYTIRTVGADAERSPG